MENESSKTEKDLAKLCHELMAENERLKRQINGYIAEFRVCRFCANVHSDCSPTDSTSCYPRWRGL